MCVPYDATPPIAPIAGAAVDTEDLTLTSRDGTRFAAFVARSETPSTIGVVVLPDIRGLFPFYEELGIRLAEEGFNTVVFDFFGRTAGASKRDASFEFMPHVRETKFNLVADDVRASLDYLKSPAGGSCTSLFTLGFCWGGSNSWLQAAFQDDLSGAIGFYGRPGPSFADGSPGPIDHAKDIKAPILALMGGGDQGITADDRAALEAAFKDAGLDYEIITYPDAPHSFFDRHYAEWADASADAWRRSLEFIRKHAK